MIVNNLLTSVLLCFSNFISFYYCIFDLLFWIISFWNFTDQNRPISRWECMHRAIRSVFAAMAEVPVVPSLMPPFLPVGELHTSKQQAQRGLITQDLSAAVAEVPFVDSSIDRRQQQVHVSDSSNDFWPSRELPSSILRQRCH